MIHLALVFVLGLPTPSGYSVTSTTGSWSVLTNASSQNLIGWADTNNEWVAFQQPGEPTPENPEPAPPDDDGEPPSTPPRSPTPGPSDPAIIPIDFEEPPYVNTYLELHDDATQTPFYYSYMTINGIDCTIFWTSETEYNAYQIMSGNWTP